MPYKLLKLNYETDKVEDLERSVAALTGIPQDNLSIVLRHEQVYKSDVRLELLNMDWAKSLLLKGLHTKLGQGHVLFVEANNIKNTKFEELEWHKAIMAEQNNLKLNITATGLVDDSTSDTFTLTLAKDKTLADLKAKISARIGVPSEGFTVRRQHVVRQFKDLDSTMV
jgi:hypothetical protein